MAKLFFNFFFCTGREILFEERCKVGASYVCSPLSLAPPAPPSPPAQILPPPPSSHFTRAPSPRVLALRDLMKLLSLDVLKNVHKCSFGDYIYLK